VSDQLSQRLRAIGTELAAMSQTGLAFATDRYDLARYRRLREIGASLLADVASPDLDVPALQAILECDGGYATPHLDVRGALFDDAGRVLLVREASDGRWTLPGGWADAEDQPRDAVEREFAEEAGLAVRAVRVTAVDDGVVSNGHAKRGAPFHVWKVFFGCERRDDAQPAAGLDGETTDVGFFALGDLPPLSTGRTTVAQLEWCARSHADPSLPARAD